MRRISGPTAVPDLFGPGKNGFKNGNKALGIPATKLTAEMFNAWQEEICTVIEAAGLVLDTIDNSQLLQAMSIILSNADMAARFTTIGTIVLNGLAVQAGGDWDAPLTANNVILVKNQAAPATNGWYLAAAGAWTRVPYLNESIEIKAGMLTKVTQGATLADTLWMLTTDDPIEINTTSLNYDRKDGNQIIKATTAQAVAGSNDSAYMTALKSLQLIQAVFNVSDIAPLFACRGWVKFNGTTILGGGNVSSITSLGGGSWRVNYITALPHTNYACHVSAVDSGASGTTIGNPSSYATNYVDIRLTVSSFDNAGADSSSSVSVSVFC